jgi:hypothetical protein
MIAMLPSQPAEAKGPLDPKAPGPNKAVAGQLPGATPALPPDFASWVDKALAGLPGADAFAKQEKEKSSVKSTSADKDNKDHNPSTPNDGAAIGVEPPPPLPPLPLPKFSGRAGAAPSHSTVAGLSDNAQSQSRLAAMPANEKRASQPASSLKPAPTETPAKTAAESAAKAGAEMNGMTVAPNAERMKFAAEQNKIAGSAPPKTPPVSSISSAATLKADSPTAKIRLPIDFSAKDNSAEQLSLTAPKAAAISTPVAVTAVAAVQAPSQVDRVERMITREAVSFKSSGADEVGVSLKIDAHTQLFLQLSYRDGQTQAVLRCEKGDVPALSAHFGQLQESLARQNIQLQSSNNGSDLGRQGSSGRPSQDSSPKQEAPVKDDAKLTSSPKPKTKTVSRQGWETWA